ncbi:MAG: NAD-dependent epimerase/dehydratase family protein [Clostridiales bacterium]|jgi:nucleoside-diphosphate-sugar epimerase|nr:NAD-dependent epimerase/dehydratase family protein [Clostridiales bacterium]
MKALFIGGTGTISTEISKLAASLGVELYLLNRGNRNTRLDGVPGINYIRGDIESKETQALLKSQKFDVVADFIVFTREQIERDIELFSGNAGQYIFISSASAYQKPLSHYLITESTPLANPYWEYSRNKIACEEALIEAYRRNGFPMTVVRPSHTYDKHTLPLAIHGKNGVWSVIKRVIDGKPVIVHGDGSSLWTVTHSRDFAKAFTGLMGNIHAIGEAVHIMSDESLTWDQIYYIIGGALGVKPDIRHISTDCLVRHDPELLGGLTGDKSNTVVFDTSKIKRLVPGFTATIRFDQGARESISYFLENPAVQAADPEFDAWTDKVILDVCG